MNIRKDFASKVSLIIKRDGGEYDYANGLHVEFYVS